MTTPSKKNVPLPPGPDFDKGETWAEYEAKLPKRGRKLWSEVFADEIAALKKARNEK